MKSVRTAWEDRELAVFRDRFAAERAVEALRESGIQPREVSAFDEDTRRELASPPIPEAIAGAAVFGFAGTFVGAMIPGSTPLVVWGAVLAGAAIGALVASRLGARDPWFRQSLREHQLHDGAIMLHVRCTPTERDEVRRVLRAEGGVPAGGELAAG